MKGFKDFIIEMAVGDAMRLFDLPSGFDRKQLKTAYARASKQAHPDQGGSHDAMVKVNSAYEVLKKNVGHEEAFAKWKDERRAEQADSREAMAIVIANLKSRFRYDIYEKHFEKAYGENFSYRVIKEVPSPNDEIKYGVPFATLEVEYFNDDRSIVYNVAIQVAYGDVRASRGTLGGGSDVTYEMTVKTSGVENGKKKKMSRYEYSSTNRKTVLEDPETVFPMKKLKTKSKSTKFKRADAISYVEKTLGAKDKFGSGKDTVWYLPTGEKGYYLTITRNTLLGQGAWTPFSIFYTNEKGRKVKSKDPKHDIPFKSFPENMDTMEILKKVTKTKPDNIEKLLKKEYDKMIAALK